MFDYYTLV